MKKWLQETLVCPECLPRESVLDLKIKEACNDDVLNGKLHCSGCGINYPIRQGVAVLLPEASRSVLAENSRYNSKGMLSAYLWSHFCDLFKDSAASDAYRKWASLFKETNGPALDIGCAVGRLSFELSRTHSQVIGIDSSLSFIEKARELLQQRKLCFNLIVEGHITQKRSYAFSDKWDTDRVDFIVADALALPFPTCLFPTVSSINILEKVPKPSQHLTEINRVLTRENARFVFSDPFSWDETVSDPELWLGGKLSGQYSGRGIDCMHRIISGEDGIFSPPMVIAEKGEVSWKIRKTEHLWEHITSQYLVGTR